MTETVTRSCSSPDLYQVEGNPECNAKLQPGFSSDMKYVYEIPDTAVPMFFGFYEPFVQKPSDIKFIDVSDVALP